VIRRLLNLPFTIQAQAMMWSQWGDHPYHPGLYLDVHLPSGRVYPVEIIESDFNRETGELDLRVKRVRKWWKIRKFVREFNLRVRSW